VNAVKIVLLASLLQRELEERSAGWPESLMDAKSGRVDTIAVPQAVSFCSEMLEKHHSDEFR
jgi:hypothetical protein